VNDPTRLALGTFTRVTVPPPRVVDRRVAGIAMLLAPVVGLALAVVPALIVLAVGTVDGPPLLGAALATGALAWLTRGLHLDGLADVADGLGSAASPNRARAIMKDPSVGAFGVMSVVLVVLTQVVALGSISEPGAAAFALVVAVVTGRLSVTWTCTTGVRAAAQSGLGAAVAGTVARTSAAMLTVAIVAGTTLAAWALGLGPVALWPTAVVAGLLAAAALTRTAVRRFGGVSGDVLGATLEAATTVVLVLTALA
jgi:adenosylcobinamide-GDP ribazoletransferase